jgi:flagellar M-ring protein FliF
MPPALTRSLERGRSALSVIGVGQKILIGLMIAGLLLGGAVFARWVTAPSYAPLFSNLPSTDASAIVEELNAAGVKYDLADGGGTIMVDKERVYDLRLDMSGKGLPAGDNTGYALLDKQGITTSEFQQQVEYQRALEGELAKTLQSLDGVRTAVVHVALPKEEVFVSDTGKPTASVLLDLAPGTSLDAGQIQAVTHLVSSSIEGMEADQVTVADNTGQVLSAAGSDLPLAGAGDAQSQMEQEYEARLADNAQQILDRLVGPGQAVVRVRADLNFDARETRSETFIDPEGTPPLSESTTTETYEGGGGPIVGGVLGPENQPDAGGNGADSNYEKETRTTNNAIGKQIQTVKDAPGAVERLTVSVVMDQRAAVALDPDEVQELVSNAVGFDQERGDAITVAEMPFDQTAAEQAAEELAAAKAAEEKAQQMAMIQYAAIAFLVLLVLLALWISARRRRRRNTPVVYEPAPATMSAEQIAELDSIRAEIAAKQNAVAIEAVLSDDEVERRQRVRTEIASMISDNPDEVAAMLRGWLAEEKV